MRRNGTSRVKIKTIHGEIEMEVQRWQVEGSGEEVTYLDLKGELREGYISERLKEVSVYYSNRMSYEEVAGLVERISGKRQLSDQKIQEMVIEKAEQVSREQVKVRQRLEEAGVERPEVRGKVDIYATGKAEIVVFDDAIGVREQKATRDKEGEEGEKAKETKWVTTDVVLIGKRDGSYEYVTGSLGVDGSEGESVEVNVMTSLKRAYGINPQASQPEQPKPLDLVVISDGAQAIRCRWLALCGPVTIILDWYHLRRKVRELMSMIAKSKSEKTIHIQQILSHLWRGKTLDAIQYLETRVDVRNAAKHQEFIGYLEKHQVEIIDYGRRQKIKKPIGSGRGEKGVDQVIGHRQKKKGMSWSPTGSRALGILKVVELNDQWSTLWPPMQSAA